MASAPLKPTDPETAARALCDAPGFLWLDSSDTAHRASRYSYLCLDPVGSLVITPRDRQAGANAVKQRLSALMPRHPVEHEAGGPPFQGGLAGYLSYETAGCFMPHFRSRHPGAAPLGEFRLYDTVVAFDLAAGTARIFSAGLARPDAAPDAALAQARLSRVVEKLGTAPSGARPAPPDIRWHANRPEQAYVDAVERTRDYILDGDIYQANIAQTFTASRPSGPELFALYLALRDRSPTPFAAFGRFEGRTLLSFSPERLISLDADGTAMAQPIKGTTARSSDPKEDARRRVALSASAKDRAENIMIVDLLRNDLSRVCQPHSVTVSGLCELETFAGLHHLTSTVTGALRPGLDMFDLIGAVFPGGSITGAPKLRAMEIIDTLEDGPRGAFCGSLGYVGFSGHGDFNIMIRTMDALPDAVTLKAGAGITLASDPQAEARETRLKIARLSEQSAEAAP